MAARAEFRFHEVPVPAGVAGTMDQDERGHVAILSQTDCDDGAVGITREALAHRLGVDVGDVDRLVETGLITPDDASTFTGGDVWRARFLLGLEQGGVPLEAVAEVVRRGDLAFDFFDDDYWDRFGGLSDATFADVSRETGLSHALLAAVRESSGYARPTPEDRVRKDEFDAIELLKVTVASGVSAEAAESHLRVWGENLSRIADADASFWHEQVEVPMLEAGLSQSQMLAATGEVSALVAPLLDPALLSTYHARSEHTWMAGVVEAVEATLEQAGLHQSGIHPPAMCFLDVSGYTELTEEQGDAAAAEVSTRLGELVRRGSLDQAGRPVKSLGDGVMVHFKEPAKAVGFALEMRDAVPTVGPAPVARRDRGGAADLSERRLLRSHGEPRRAHRLVCDRQPGLGRRPDDPGDHRRRCGVRRDRARGAQGGRAARPTVGSSPPHLIRRHARVGHAPRASGKMRRWRFHRFRRDQRASLGTVGSPGCPRASAGSARIPGTTKTSATRRRCWSCSRS